MKTELAKLIAVAKIDAEIDELNQRREKLPEIIRDLDSKLSGLLATQTLKKSEIEALTREKTQKEMDRAAQKDWIAAREEKVREIKTNKEYHASLKEISQAKKTLFDLEAALSQIDTRIGENQAAINGMEGQLAEQKSTFEKEIEEAKKEMGLIERHIEEKVDERTVMEKELKETLLKKYKTIKNRIAPALAHAHQGTCQECNTRIPPQLYIELQKYQQIVNCPRCHRILFIEMNEQAIVTPPAPS